MTIAQGNTMAGLAFSPPNLGQGDGWYGVPLRYKKHLGMFLAPTGPKSESSALKDLFNHRIRNYILHSRLGSNSISKC